MTILRINETKELTEQIVGCSWIYSVKYLPDGQVECLKARLVTEGYTQPHGVDYFETVSSSLLHSVQILLSVVGVKGVHHLS